MLIKTDFTENVRRAKITLECQLRHEFYRHSYDSYAKNGKIDLDAVAEGLSDVEYESINSHGKTTTTLSAVTPVGDRGGHDWLVIELVDTDWNRQDEAVWRDFLAEVTAKIFLRLVSDQEAGGLATVDTGSTRFVVMEDPDHSGHDKDYIFI